MKIDKHRLAADVLLIGSALSFALSVGIVAWFIFAPRPAHAHQSPTGWEYPSDCCTPDGMECDPVPDGAVQHFEKYVIVTLNPGDHKHIKKPMVFKKFRQGGKVRYSGDHLTHACVSTSGKYLWCVFYPVYG